MQDLPYKQEVYQIIGAAIEVHRHLGFGFLESVYQEALELELRLRQIPYTAQYPINIHYKDWLLKKDFWADFLCFSDILVEIKAVEVLASEHSAQVLNYLHGSSLPLGLLINFGSRTRLEWKRMIVEEYL